MSLSVGDIAPACMLPDRRGSLVDLRSDAIAGNVIAVVFCPGYTAAAAQVMADYRSQLEEIGSAAARFFCVIRTQPEGPAGTFRFRYCAMLMGKCFEHSTRTHVIT